MNTTIPFPTKLTGRLAFPLGLLIALALLLAPAGSAHASNAIALDVIASKSHIIKQSIPIKRVSITDPDIADVVEISPTEIQVVGRSIGTTTLIIWDKYEKKTFFDIKVTIDTTELEERMREVAPGDNINVKVLQDTVIVSGVVSSGERWLRIDNILQGYARNVTETELVYLEGGVVKEIRKSGAVAGGKHEVKFVNLLEIDHVMQVLLQITVASIDRNATRELGINWVQIGKYGSVFSSVATGAPFNEVAGLIAGAQQGGADFAFTNSPNFGVVDAHNGTAYMIRALSGKGLAKILAEPNLIVKSGETGHFLAGGEFPIPIVTTASAGEAAPVTVSFKEFGVRLNFSPIVTESGIIQLKLDPAEVSSLDFANAVTVSGFNIPALIKDSVQTSVDLREGETFVMAGLLRSEWSKNLDKFPILGDIPILGAFFRDQQMRKTERELVFLVTPKLITPMKAGERMALPGSNEPTAAQMDDLRWMPLLPTYRSVDPEQLR